MISWDYSCEKLWLIPERLTIVKPSAKEHCIDCVNFVEGDICHVCQFIPKRKTTNADRIRAMTDKELCAFLCDLTDCPVCPGSEVCEDGCGWDKENKVMKGLYAWLKQEVKE
jgi:hypothetical protein